MIALLVNLAAICFFLSTLFALHRKWHARHNMQSISLEGTFMHFFGDLFALSVALYVNASIAIALSLFHIVLGILILYWKGTWLFSNYDIHFFCWLGWHKWHNYTIKDEEYRQCLRCYKIQEWYGIHDGCHPHWYWKDVKE